jgi:hypothetical protein
VTCRSATPQKLQIKLLNGIHRRIDDIRLTFFYLRPFRDVVGSISGKRGRAKVQFLRAAGNFSYQKRKTRFEKDDGKSTIEKWDTKGGI